MVLYFNTLFANEDQGNRQILFLLNVFYDVPCVYGGKDDLDVKSEYFEMQMINLRVKQRCIRAFIVLTFLDVKLLS